MAEHVIFHRKPPGEVLSGTLAVLLLGAVIALVALNASDAAVIAAATLLTAVSIVAILIAKGYEFRRLGISTRGVDVEIAEVKQKQEKISTDVDTLGVAVVGLRTVPERMHLEALTGNTDAFVEFRQTLVDELDHLENLENIKSRDPTRRIRDALWDGPGKEWEEKGKKDTEFNLKDYARILPAGEKYLAAVKKYA